MERKKVTRTGTHHKYIQNRQNAFNLTLTTTTICQRDKHAYATGSNEQLTKMFEYERHRSSTHTLRRACICGSGASVLSARVERREKKCAHTFTIQDFLFSFAFFSLLLFLWCCMYNFLFNIQPRCGNAHIPGFFAWTFFESIQLMKRVRCSCFSFFSLFCVFSVVFESDTINTNPPLTHISFRENACTQHGCKLA